MPTAIGCQVTYLLVLLATFISISESITIGPRREKTCLWGFTNNTGAEQPAHTRSLISAFVIRFWKCSYVNLPQVKFKFSI